jgi:hypothetical protein
MRGRDADRNRWSPLVPIVCMLAFLLNATPALLGQDDQKANPAPPIAIYVLHTGRDAVGTALANELSVAIGKNRKYTLARTEQDATILLHLVTVEAACAPGRNTAAAIAVITNNRAQSLLDLRSVTVSGDLETREMAARTLGNIDSVIDEWRASIR